MTRLTIVLAATLTLSAGLSACAQNSATQPEGQSAVEGAALTRTCPAERAEVRCPMSAVPDVTLIFERDGREIARVNTDSDGRYYLELPPGTYLVSAPTGLAFTKEPFEVHVWEGETSRAYFPLNGGPICGGECLTPSPDSR